MKNLIPLAILGLAAISPSFKPSDSDCQPYYPIKQGVVREMRNYKAGDKLTSRVVQTVTNATTTGSTFTLTAKSDCYDDKDKLTSSTDFIAKCESGVFYINLAANIDPDQTKARSNMTVKVTGDDIDMPSNPTNGQQLKGGTMTVSMSQNNAPPGIGTTNIVTTITNRKVDSASVSVTTPAGAFNCVRISYDITMKVLFNINSHVVEWYSKNIGKVRSETYSDKGKLNGYSILYSITK